MHLHAHAYVEKVHACSGWPATIYLPFCVYSQVAALCAARLNGSAPLPERLGLCERWLEVLPRHLKPLCDAAWSHATLGGARVAPLASSGRTWRHWAELAAQHAQWERCLNAKPLPRVLELAASKVADSGSLWPSRRCFQWPLPDAARGLPRRNAAAEPQLRARAEGAVRSARRRAGRVPVLPRSCSKAWLIILICT